MPRKPKAGTKGLLESSPSPEAGPPDDWGSVEVPKGRFLRPTLRMRKFVNFYLGECDGNATRAAAMAGYGNVEKAAERMMKSDWVKAQISHFVTQAMPAGEVLVRLSRQASNDVTDFADCFVDREDVIGVDKAGNPITQVRRILDMKKVKERNLGYLVKKITPGKFGDTVELYDSQSALNIMAKHHKLLVDRIETNGNVDLDALTDEELEKLAKRMK